MTGPTARRRSGPRSGSPRGLAGAPPRGSPRGPRRAPTVPSRRLGRALTAARAGRRAQLTELVEWLAIPSVSGDSRHAADVVRAADLLAGSLRRAGATVATLGTPAGAPVVVGWVPGRRGWPTVLVYGHYDVVSAGSGWTSPPFRPALRDGALVARGSADDKGQLSACLAALHAWSAVGGPPCTVVVAADGAEEIGSPGLRPALARLARHVRPDLVLVCDTERAPDGAPSVTLSQRGHAVVELVVQTGGSPVHAGRFGGAVVDPAQELARAVHAVRAALPTGRQVSGPVVSNRPDADIIRATGGRAVLGAGLDEKVTLGPALTVVRTDAGSGPGLVPVRAAARLDLRLPPAADVGCAVAAARRAARAATSPDVRLNLTVLRGASGLSAEPEEGDLVLLDHVARFAFGRGVQLVRSGGSLPAASMLAEEFGRTPVLLGLGTPGGGAHGPDERMDLLGWTRASALLVAVFGSSCASSGGFGQYPTPSAQHCDSYRS